WKIAPLFYASFDVSNGSFPVVIAAVVLPLRDGTRAISRIVIGLSFQGPRGVRFALGFCPLSAALGLPKGSVNLFADPRLSIGISSFFTRGAEFPLLAILFAFSAV